MVTITEGTGNYMINLYPLNMSMTHHEPPLSVLPRNYKERCAVFIEIVACAPVHVFGLGIFGVGSS